jgi:hypothetical protein
MKRRPLSSASAPRKGCAIDATIEAAAAKVALTNDFVKTDLPPRPAESRERPASSKLAAPYVVSRRGEIPFSHEGQQSGDENLVLPGFRRSRAMRRYSNDTASLSDWPLPWGGGS